MKLKTILLAVVATVCSFSISQASITSASWNTTDPSILNCTYLYPFSGNALSMDATQLGPIASMVGSIQTDTPADPTLTLGSSVNNDTGNPWLGYQVNVVMNNTFSFTTPGPTVNNPPANDWFVAGVVNPTLQVSGPYAGKYEGTLYFSEGTPVGVGGELDWLYSIHFASSTDYAFTQEMIPWFTPIPEPSTLALMGMGGVVLMLRLARKSRRGV